MHDYVLAMIYAFPSTLAALGAWRASTRTHSCLESHIEATSAHHSIMPEDVRR